MQLLSKLRARHVIPTLGKPLDSDDDFSLSQASDDVQVSRKNVTRNFCTESNANDVETVSAQKDIEINTDDDEEGDDDDGNLRIIFQTQEGEAPEVGNRGLESNLPVPGTSIKRSRRLQPEDFCTPRDSTSPKLSDAAATLRRSTSDTATKGNLDNSASPFFAAKKLPPKSSLLFPGPKKSPLKPQQTVKRKYNVVFSTSINSRQRNEKKRKTPLFSLPSSVMLNQKSPLRDRSKMRNSFLSMGKKIAKTGSSKTLFGRK